MRIKVKKNYSWFGYIMEREKLSGRNLILLQYPDGAADCPLRVNTELKKSGCMEEDVGVFVWEKGKVTM